MEDPRQDLTTSSTDPTARQEGCFALHFLAQELPCTRWI